MSRIAKTASKIDVSVAMLAKVTDCAIASGNAKADLVAQVKATGINESNWEVRKDELAKVAEAAKVGFAASAIMRRDRLNDPAAAIKLAKVIMAKAIKSLTPSELAVRRNVADKEWSRVMGACGFTSLSGRTGRGNKTAKPEAAKPEAAKPEAAKPEAAKPEAAKPEATKVVPTTVKTVPEMVTRVQALASEMAMLLTTWGKNNTQAKAIMEVLLPHVDAVLRYGTDKVLAKSAKKGGRK